MKRTWVIEEIADGIRARETCITVPSSDYAFPFTLAGTRRKRGRPRLRPLDTWSGTFSFETYGSDAGRVALAAIRTRMSGGENH